MASDVSCVQPAQYGKRPVRSHIDELAQSNANHVLAQIPRTSNFKDGLIDITLVLLANSIDRAAMWIESIIRRSDTFETAAYIGQNK